MNRYVVAIAAALVSGLWGILTGGLSLVVVTLAAITVVAFLVCWHYWRNR